MPMKPVQRQEADLLRRLDESSAAIRARCSMVPEVAIILGTGLGNLIQKVEVQAEIAYGEIPHFPVSTVESHKGKLALGFLAGQRAAVMEGRFHYYEGYSTQEVTFPVRVLRHLGCKVLVVTNAAGGLNLGFRKGEIVIIEDHINMMGVNPLIGPNDERVGPRFPDMSEPYSARLAGLAEQAAREEKIAVRRGVYLGVSGPCLETRAEYRMMRNLGADLVGMSTIPEVIVGVHMGLEILGMSVVTDVCDPDHLAPVNIKEIIHTANEAGPRLDRLVQATIAKM